MKTACGRYARALSVSLFLSVLSLCSFSCSFSLSLHTCDLLKQSTCPPLTPVVTIQLEAKAHSNA